ncbi:uncharacterized protein I303_107634 [Kwoniella dejecticola CBS 10117]|uniref:Uncharacterized protein n=1 Tax=Kwoniella dejecticola CBS 10117 TaxID=1296121 RepID=A0A1A5ZVA8_9TREE|nr:uncharacterized protein I303_07645 [Kwoniella dejecticola CBS 10117]OBR81735.1 hypothetical protein I303_07645 [Kwoniella dejecticola CBS 10117]
MGSTGETRETRHNTWYRFLALKRENNLPQKYLDMMTSNAKAKAGTSPEEASSGVTALDSDNLDDQIDFALMDQPFDDLVSPIVESYQDCMISSASSWAYHDAAYGSQKNSLHRFNSDGPQTRAFDFTAGLTRDGQHFYFRESI